MILEAKKLERLTRNKIEQRIGVDGTIYKAYDDDREPADPEIVRKLIGTLGIRQEWWDKEWETGSKEIFNTSVQNPQNIPEKPLRDPSVLMRELADLDQLGYKLERTKTLELLENYVKNLEEEVAEKEARIQELETRTTPKTPPQNA